MKNVVSMIEWMERAAPRQIGCPIYPPHGSSRNKAIFALSASAGGTVSWFRFDETRRQHEITRAEALELLQRDILVHWKEYV